MAVTSTILDDLMPLLSVSNAGCKPAQLAKLTVRNNRLLRL
jgi:hypothetical protein